MEQQGSVVPGVTDSVSLEQEIFGHVKVILIVRHSESGHARPLGSLVMPQSIIGSWSASNQRTGMTFVADPTIVNRRCQSPLPSVKGPTLIVAYNLASDDGGLRQACHGSFRSGAASLSAGDA